MLNCGRREFLGAVAAGCLCGGTASARPGGSKTLPDFPTMTQPDDISCGPTCAAMVLKWYGRDGGVERCKTKSGTRWLQVGKEKVGMTTPSGLNDCLNALGVPSRVVKGDISSIVSCIDQGRPPILLLRSDVKLWHWVTAIGYDEKNVRLSDPSGSQYNISRSNLDASWTFSADMQGKPTGGRRCAPCGGSGKLASAKVPCTNCAGTGKMISNFKVKSCGKCGGGGKINVSGGQCLVCSGSGTSPDMFRKAVESAGVSGRTMVVPDNGRPVKIAYSIKNTAGRAVMFSMAPSGKSYTLGAGKTFSGHSFEVNGKPPTIKLGDSGRTYHLTAGNHKFWWMTKENRVGFDRSTD